MRKIKSAISFRWRAFRFFFTGKISFSCFFEQLFPRSRRSQKNTSLKMFGKRFDMPIVDIGPFIELIHQIVEKDQYHTGLIKSGDVVVDAGANTGVFSIFVAEKNPDVTISAFEPTPETFSMLQKNTEQYPNVKCFNFALGEKNEKSSIVVTGRGGEANYIGEGGVPIEIKTIDSLSIPMNFLKMDVEGYEANIIIGASETIKKYKPVVAMSAYHKPNDKTELPALLNSIIPYNCELRHDCEEDFICKAK